MWTKPESVSNCILTRELRCSQPWRFKSQSSLLWRLIAIWQDNKVSEEHAASIFRYHPQDGGSCCLDLQISVSKWRIFLPPSSHIALKMDDFAASIFTLHPQDGDLAASIFIYRPQNGGSCCLHLQVSYLRWRTLLPPFSDIILKMGDLAASQISLWNGSSTTLRNVGTPS